MPSSDVKVGRDADDNRVTFIQADRLWRSKFLGLRGTWLRFDSLVSESRTRKRIPADLLEKFTRLDSDAAIAKFADEWGALGLYAVNPDRPTPRPMNLVEASRDDQKHKERIDWWHAYITEFAVLFQLTGWVGDRTKPDIESGDIQRLGYLVDEVSPFGVAEFVPLFSHDEWKSWPSGSPEREGAVRDLLISRLNLLIYLCGMRPALTADVGGNLDVVFRDRIVPSRPSEGAISLFGALTLQLMAATLGEGLRRCAAVGCGKRFTGARNWRFCASCGRNAAVAAARRTYRRSDKGRAATKRQRQRAKRRRESKV